MESKPNERDLPTIETGGESGASVIAPRPSLRQDSRTRAQARIIQGALTAVAAWGLDATIDQVADAAGVSRRTVFRHFTNHGELILATLNEIEQIFETEVPAPPAPEADLEGWLTDAIVSMHELSRHLLGRAFWDLHTDRPNISPEVTVKIATTIPLRQRYAETVAAEAWRALDGDGSPPTWVMDAFSMHISGFATNAFPSKSAQETGRLSARILWLVLTSSLYEQRQDRANANSTS